ncbi:MAG: tetratricopeptide repeat protein [Candidatus Omnitrophota bacterium]
MKKICGWISHMVQRPDLARMILAAAALIVFLNILPNDFIMDDFDFVLEWNLIRDLRNLPRFFIDYITPEAQEGIYSPLRTLAFSLNYLIFRDFAAGWHAVSILIHVFGVWAVYSLTLIMAGNLWAAFLTALIFAVHPVHIESVSSITGSIDTIGVVLGLWSFYWYIRSVLPEGRGHVFHDDGSWNRQGGRDTINKKIYIRSVVLGVLAIFTHEIMLSLPVLIFMFDFLFLEPRFSWKKALKRAAPFIIAGIVYVLAKAAVLGGISRGDYAFHNPYLTFLVVIKAWAKYIGVLAFPLVLTHNRIISNGIMSFDEKDFDRAAFFAQSWHDPLVLLSFGLLLAILLTGLFFYRRKPLVSFCIFWFFLSLLPVSQIVPSSVYYAERYLYAGSWGYCLIFALLLWKVSRKFATKEKAGAVISVAVCIVIIAYGARTIMRNRDFHDWTKFYEKAVRLNPQSAYLKNDLAILYAEEGRYEQAEKEFLSAIEIQKDNPHFYFSLAQAYAYSGQIRKAMEALEKSIAVNENFGEAYFNLAIAEVGLGNEEAGRQMFSKAISAWKKEGKILEAGEAVNSFQIFLLNRKGKLKPLSAKDFLGAYVNE